MKTYSSGDPVKFFEHENSVAPFYGVVVKVNPSTKSCKVRLADGCIVNVPKKNLAHHQNQYHGPRRK